MRGLPNFRNVDGTPAPIIPITNSSAIAPFHLNWKSSWGVSGGRLWKNCLALQTYLPSTPAKTRKSSLMSSSYMRTPSEWSTFVQVPYIFEKSTYASNSHTWKVASGARCLSRPKLKRTERQWTLQTYLLLPITTEKERKNQISWFFIIVGLRAQIGFFGWWGSRWAILDKLNVTYYKPIISH